MIFGNLQRDNDDGASGGERFAFFRFSFSTAAIAEGAGV
jgi:hypothetical protein